MPRTLIVFDLDGTLLQSVEADDAAFMAGVTRALPGVTIDTDWAGYPHTTDAAIGSELFRRHYGRPPTDAELLAMMDCVCDDLAATCPPLEPLPGAPAVLDTVADDASLDAVIATGAWQRSAQIKLANSPLRARNLPMATSTDGHSREQIVCAAIERAGGRYDRIISIGDGVWDVRTAAKLALPFIGIATGSRADRLREAGAAIVIPDYHDAAAFLAHVGDAPVPTP